MPPDGVRHRRHGRILDLRGQGQAKGHVRLLDPHRVRHDLDAGRSRRRLLVRQQGKKFSKLKLLVRQQGKHIVREFAFY